MIEEVIEEVNEIAKARVEALGGNCLLGMKMDVNTLDQTMQNHLYILISIFGDVVELEHREQEIAQVKE